MVFLVVGGVIVPGTVVALCVAVCMVVLGYKSVEGTFGVLTPD